jgi:SAM-dependent methyltransferase
MIRQSLLEVLACPTCGSRMAATATGTSLQCAGCTRLVPIRDGIPRFVDVADDPLARRTQESFGYEWTHFSDWTISGTTNFDQYFSGVDLPELRSARVLDAGCGMGRHARMIAPYARHVVALDFSLAVDRAAHNTGEAGNVDCVQADITAPPFADGTFDYVYSLGVLHHLADTAGALAGLVRKVRSGGKMRVYLYWKHHGWKGAALAAVNVVRFGTARLPHPVLRVGCWLLSLGLMGAVVWPYRILSAAGATFHESLPLFVYARYPFRILYNDQFDRFSAPLEQRFDPDEVRGMLEAAGLRDVTVHASFGWIGEGTRP